MKSEIDGSKISLNSSLLTWLKQIRVPIVVVLEIAISTMQSDSFAANPRVRKTESITSPEVDDQTFSPTARISGSVGKGGNNEKQDVLLVKRLLSKFGYELALNGEADAALNSAIGQFQAVYVPAKK